MRLLLCVLLTVLCFYGCTPQKSKKVKDVVKQTEKEVSGVADYATGATQMRAKKKSTQRIKNINQKHNDDLEKALEE
ncbi:MAG: hypothetical protein WCS73_04020 [Lentisphaeria bacterium]